MGRIMVHLGAAVEALPSVARVHVSRWGDGGSHAHVFFFARPARMPQLRGTCLALWDDFLPPVPVEVRDANARAAVAGLVARLRWERPRRGGLSAGALSAGAGPSYRPVGRGPRSGHGLWSFVRRPPDRLGAHVREWRIL